MELDALILARMQFAFTVAFHIVFPAFSIGLASYLAVLEALWLKTGRDLYLNLFKYWLKIFAVAFGMGVVSGLVMSYQFGTNWSVFSDKAGPVIGPLMAYEVLSAFFLEAGFLGVMLFGLNRVGKKLHFLATLMVAIGTFASAFWILSVNSWMQTPQGYAINEVGQFVPADWFKIVFNPSFPYRLAHMLLAAYLTTGLVVGGFQMMKAITPIIEGLRTAELGLAAVETFRSVLNNPAAIALVGVAAGAALGVGAMMLTNNNSNQTTVNQTVVFSGGESSDQRSTARATYEAMGGF